MSHLYYTYVLQSLRDQSFYVGSCEDLDVRISKHNDGFSKYSKSKVPWRLRYFEVFETRSAALKREYAIKRMKSRKYIVDLIESWLKG
jgi:putative endonuclease